MVRYPCWHRSSQLCPNGVPEGQLITLFNGGIRNSSGTRGPEVIATAKNASSFGEQHCDPDQAGEPACHYVSPPKPSVAGRQTRSDSQPARLDPCVQSQLIDVGGTAVCCGRTDLLSTWPLGVRRSRHPNGTPMARVGALPTAWYGDRPRPSATAASSRWRRAPPAHIRWQVVARVAP